MTIRSRRVIDLTHPIHPNMPVAVGFPRVLLANLMDQAAGDVATVEVMEANLHAGTHVDAPFHFLADRPPVDALHPLALCGSAVVVDVPPTEEWRAVEGTDALAWEQRTGERIGAGDIVLLRTGHARHWAPTPAGMAYMTAPWPYLGTTFIDLLLEREIAVYGVECPDPDRVDQRDLGSATFEGHRRLLGAGIPIIENLANLETIPLSRIDFIALALPIVGASGSPIRALALLPG